MIAVQGRSATRRRWGRALTAAGSTLLTIGVSLIGLVLVTFVIGRLLPADPVLAVLGDTATQAQYDALAAQMHLDKPLWQQFAIYAGDILRGDFGHSRMTGAPVLQDIARFLPATFELATLAIVIGVATGVPLGALGALYAGRPVDHLVRLLSLLGHSFPIFWLGLVGLLVFYATLGWVEGPGRIGIVHQYSVPNVTGLLLVDTLLAGNGAAFRNALGHIILPGTILGLAALGYIGRMTRSFLLTQMRQDYVTVARLKGLSDAAILWRHALPNAAAPIVAVIALTYASLLEGAVLTETVFAWPGLGLYITQSLFAADLPPVLAGTLVVAVIFMLCNLLAELFQRVIDPRTRQD